MKVTTLLGIGLAGLSLLGFHSAHADVFINEFHYDNAGTDTNERIEVIAPAGTNLSGWSIVLYNGSGGAVYATLPLSGTTTSQCGGHGTAVVTVGSTGLQNGAPDGFALVNASNQVVQFLSYEGTFTATGGPASGMTSTAIPQSESEATSSGHSLRLTGTGSSYSQFSWAPAATSSFGACNAGQTLTAPGGGGGGSVLSNGVPVSGLAATSGNAVSYTITVPSGASNLAIQTSGGSGDADLYVRFGSAPTTSSYDCRPYLSGNSESCSFATPQAGTWHVMVRAYTSFTGLTLSGSYSSGPVDNPPTLSSSTPASGASGIAANANIALNFSEPVTLVGSWYTLSCSTTGTHAAVVSGGPTSFTLNPSVDFGAGETCTLTVIGANVRDQDGTVTPMASNATVSFSTAGGGGGGNVLSNGVPAGGLTATSGNALNYTMVVPSGASNLVIQTSGGSGDADLYVRFGSAPTTSTYDCRPYANGNTESCSFPTPQAGTWHVMVRAYTTFSGLTLGGSYSTGGGGSGYYAGVVTSSASALRSSLHPIIDDHTRIPYTASTTDTWDVLNQADQDPLNSGKVLDIYKNASYTKASGGNDFYNREHTWPNSLGFGTDGSTNYAYTDLHMLMVSDISYNSARGNKPYDNCPSGCTEHPTNAYAGQGGGSGSYPGNSNWSNSSVFQVWSKLKGNVARAMFYMDLRYEGGTHGGSGAAEPDLRLTDNLSLVVGTGGNASVGYMGKLSTLIQWHQQDPVDEAEQLRNELIETYQGNRNPFVDHPEWVACIYQSVCN